MKAVIDWRAILLAFVLAVAAALPSVTTSVVRRDYYFFDITLTSTSPGVTQLFWDLGRGYSEQDSSRQPLKVERVPVVYRYMMPMGDFRALRLDPIDGAGEFTYAHARIVNYRGRVVREFKPADFRATHDVARLEVHGDTVLVVTKPGARDVVLELDLGGAPLHIPGDAHIWWQQARRVFWSVLALGLGLGCPAVAGGLRRGLAPAGPWLQARPKTTLFLAATLAVAVQCHPVIFQGRSFTTPVNGSLMLYGDMPTLPGMKEESYTNTMASDTGALLFNHVYYPMVERAALAHGELPLWNRYSLCGLPLLGQGQSMFGEPLLFLPILANGAAWAWDIRFLLAHWLFTAALAFTAWRLTRHLAASVLVATGSAFIAFFTFRLNHPANFSVCYAPLILWAWTGLIQAATLRRRGGWLAALILANWMVMMSGTVKEAYMAMVCLNLAGVVLLWQLPDAAGRRARILGLAAAAGGIFTLLAAPVWISFLVALKNSWTSYDAPGATPLPLAHFLGFFDDIFYRQTNADETVVAPALNFFLLLGVLWWFANRRWRDDRAGRALVLAALPPLALAFGIVPPAVITKIPFVANIIHVGNTFSCSLLVIVVLLAGCGFRDALARAREPDWRARLAGMAAIAAVLFAAYFLSTRHGFGKSPFFAGYVPALAAGAVGLTLAFRWAARLDRPGLLFVGLLVALPLLLWRHCQYAESDFDAYAFVPGKRYDLHASSAGVQYIDAHTTAPGRRVGWGRSLFPAYHIALGWEGLYGVDTLRSRHYQDLALEFDMQRVWVWDAPNRAGDAPRLVPIHDLMNTDYYVADHTTPPREFAGLQLVAQLDLDLYRSPTAWPRAFFTDRLATYGSVHDFAQLVTTGDRRPFAAGQKGQTDLPALPAELAGRSVRAATDYRLTPNTTTFTVDAPAPGIAVLTEAYYANDFEARLDGKPVPYFRVNHAFKGVAIPAAGRHEISFAYWPRLLMPSLWLAAAGAALAALGAGWFAWPAPREPAR